MITRGRWLERIRPPVPPARHGKPKHVMDNTVKDAYAVKEDDLHLYYERMHLIFVMITML